MSTVFSIIHFSGRDSQLHFKVGLFSVYKKIIINILKQVLLDLAQTVVDMERKVIPIENTNGLTWAQFANQVTCLTDELRKAEMRFEYFVKTIQRQDIVLSNTTGL